MLSAFLKSKFVILLHMNLQVANFQRCKCAFACPTMKVSSHIWSTLSCVCTLYKWWYFYAFYRTVLQRGRQQSIFISSWVCPEASRKTYNDAQYYTFQDIPFTSVAQQCLTLCDPMNCSMPGQPLYHQLLEFTQIHVH